MNNLEGCNGIYFVNEDGSKEKISFDDPRLENVDWSLSNFTDEYLEKETTLAIYDSFSKEFGEEFARKRFAEVGVAVPVMSKRD